jgi:hypothetical protein
LWLLRQYAQEPADFEEASDNAVGLHLDSELTAKARRSFASRHQDGHAGGVHVPQTSEVKNNVALSVTDEVPQALVKAIDV